MISMETKPIGCVRHDCDECKKREEAQTVEPVMWQRFTTGEWEWIKESEVALYKKMGQRVRPLFDAPQEPMNAELLDALLEIDSRLLRCSHFGLLASEAYDSFYQEVVQGAIAFAKIGAAPQPSQAERVPMTDDELDDLLPTNDSMSRTDALRWMARATERKHNIKVKP